jgi:cellulose synthase/poly-beta-1,6-N-acetylglucosamine synthase-like glycosyltransferase
MELVVVFVYMFFMIFILGYAIIQISLTVTYLRKRKKLMKQERSLSADDHRPFVTIQLPVFNEIYVVERLIESIAAFNYPKDRFEIQVLDDSTDESFEVAAKKVKEIKERGINIHHIQREKREGYKAGALKYGMEIAKGEFIAIFDADFIPDPEFLNKTLPWFDKEEIGVVQTRWEHINEDYSLLTRLQAVGLDAHFSVEQVGRNAGGHFINFNGTAGIWRKSTISDAGGWQADTITEDLDLSYRAQVKGWKFIYLENLGSPSELPAEINALKSQQFRWAKGAAECTRKNLGRVWKSANISFKTKIFATFHLLNSFVFISIMALALLTLPIVYIYHNFPEHHDLFGIFPVFFLSIIFLAIYYFVSFSRNRKNKLWALIQFLFYFPVFLAVSMGLSLYNTIGVFEGFMGKKSPFVRTPKFNIKSNKDSWRGNKYSVKNISTLTILEGLMTIYFAFTVSVSLSLEDYASLPYFISLAFGFGFVFLYSVIHSKRV